MSATISLAEVRPAVGRDRLRLAGGVLAGPVFVVSALAQGLTRDGFDFRRHPVSMLSTGTLGWLQIATFLVTGALCVGAALALRRSVASTWVPRLLLLWGLGLMAAGVFAADPADGFPAGTPRGPGQISWHGGLHFLAAAVAFVSLIVATFVVARQGRPWAVASAAVGAFFAVAWAALIAVPGPVAMVAFGVAVTAGWAWVTATFGRALRRD
ncbi:DUF998 domain-containing protein [Micromonospora sp. PLK6-60]|uniref:DUF998 domain-containing protein n=1 Tax=Micromonospora sp. PLK6-60 TaxID=2873383 RepID=UPI001CA7738E|nr:DUF998 domain-containing protein [Micromonospora sp. PLK6-60]MBY8873126.1 DUF998 domain-containing protein [Micromonospora sp. PLK6-60]